MIAEGTVLGPKQAHASQAEKEDVDYEPYEFEDGITICITICIAIMYVLRYTSTKYILP